MANAEELIRLCYLEESKYVDALPTCVNNVQLYGDEICTYFEVGRLGETCICDDEQYVHICGAYCLSEHRGKGVVQNLLNYMINTLKAEGYTRLGVDFESINPTAHGFWMKYFIPYTHSVVRRIDDNILTIETL